MNSKQKGNRGELELLHVLQDHGLDAVRNDQKFVGGLENPDISVKVNGIPVHIEVKRRERFEPYAAIEQAQRDSAGKAFPVVAYRANRKPWLLIVSMEDVWTLF